MIKYNWFTTRYYYVIFQVFYIRFLYKDNIFAFYKTYERIVFWSWVRSVYEVKCIACTILCKYEEYVICIGIIGYSACDVIISKVEALFMTSQTEQRDIYSSISCTFTCPHYKIH